MTILDAVVLGLVEGITEYLPVSSTGHLIIAAALLGLDDSPDLKRAVDAFTIVIQGGAILAVLGLYRAHVARMIAGLAGLFHVGPGDPAGARLALNLLIAFIPAAILGPLLDDAIERHLFHVGPVLAALALGGAFMIALERFRRRRAGDALETGRDIDDLSPRQALLIGLLQCLAMWPGTSRSMVTIVGGVLVGLRARPAAEFSFLLGLPTLGSACLYRLARNLLESRAQGTPNLFETFGVTSALAGLLVAALSAALAVRWLVGFLTRHGLEAFGWYRIALALVLGVLAWTGVVSISPG
jgi:undecaprenyl-diphosphatase